MIIIFGWGYETRKEYGPTMPIKCPNCNNNVFWHLLRSRIWFTLFFIPVIPYQSRYYLLCEICSQGIELRYSQIDQIKQLNQATMSFLNHEMTEEQYNTVLTETRMLE